MANCAYCQVAIADPLPQVVHGDLTFCCTNCATAMEQDGAVTAELRCAHCDVPIVDESVMQSRGDQAYCCSNCAQAMAAPSR
jgi:hypothetical protein